MNSGSRDAAQTGHKRQATDTGRHVLVIPRFGLLLANKSDATLAARLYALGALGVQLAYGCMRFFKFFPFVFSPIRSGFYLDTRQTHMAQANPVVERARTVEPYASLDAELLRKIISSIRINEPDKAVSVQSPPLRAVNLEHAALVRRLC